MKRQEDKKRITSRALIRERKEALRSDMNWQFRRLKRSATEVILPVDRKMLQQDHSIASYVTYGLIAYRTMRRVKRIVGMVRGLKKKS